LIYDKIRGGRVLFSGKKKKKKKKKKLGRGRGSDKL
jgi:hypothetical protein